MRAATHKITTSREAEIDGAVAKLAILCFPLVVVITMPGLLLAHFMPPPAEAMPASQVAHFFAVHRTGIQVGVCLIWFGTVLLFPFYLHLSKEMRKIEGGGLLADLQTGCAVITVFEFTLICLVWLLATFRPDADPQIVRAANDFNWILWTAAVPVFALQYIAIAAAGFLDRRPDPLWPRWAAWLNVGVAVLTAAGFGSIWLKTGPFSWTGAVGFYIPAAAWVVGTSTDAVLLYRRLTYEKNHAASPTDGSLRARAPVPI